MLATLRLPAALAPAFFQVIGQNLHAGILGPLAPGMRRCNRESISRGEPNALRLAEQGADNARLLTPVSRSRPEKRFLRLHAMNGRRRRGKLRSKARSAGWRAKFEKKCRELPAALVHTACTGQSATESAVLQQSPPPGASPRRDHRLFGGQRLRRIKSSVVTRLITPQVGGSRADGYQHSRSKSPERRG